MSISRIERIDRYGHCVICTKNMLVKRVVDGKVIEMFTPDHGHTDFLLNNGSKMKVCMCAKCRATTNLDDPETHELVMEAVQKGWELETKILTADEKKPEWNEESSKTYLEAMSVLSIDCHCENLDKNILISKSQELAQSFRGEKV